jgi:hypothetical protein
MKPRALHVLLVLIFMMLACNMPTEIGIVEGTPSAVTPSETIQPQTQVAMTVYAELTGTAEAATPTATHTPDLSLTRQPTVTREVLPSWTPVPILTTAVPCDQGQFIQDVTIADGTKMNPGTAFTKTWRLRNIGTCTWNSSYAVVFVSGESLGAPATIPLAGNVPPNETVDISIDMRAPSEPGRYTGYWRLRNPSGGQFSVSGNQPFYVQIDVTPVTPTVTVTPTITATNQPGDITLVDLAATLCQAEWRSQAGVLPCEGASGDANGFVQRLTNPRLETGMTESNPVILTHPHASSAGAITGKYPLITIQQGDRFQAAIGCLQGATQCSVVYQLNYIVGSAPPANLGQWTHTYGSTVQGVDVDLSALAGQQVQIILAVLANGSAEGDQAVWVNPRILRP